MITPTTTYREWAGFVEDDKFVRKMDEVDGLGQDGGLMPEAVQVDVVIVVILIRQWLLLVSRLWKSHNESHIIRSSVRLRIR